jgi:ACS family pantothenate transporter-like MFS transporter
MGRPSDAVIASAYGIDAEVASPVSSPNVSQEKLYGKPIKSWKGYIWDTWDLPKDQRWLMFKLDAFILTFASVSLPLPSPLFPLLASTYLQS